MNLLQHKTHDPINTFIVPFLHPTYILGCVESIWKHCNPEDHRLILIDCGQNDHLFEPLKDQAHLYIRSYRNLGCAKAWNIGLGAADTKYLTIMGDDTRLVHKNWWPEVYEYLRGNEPTLVFCHPHPGTQPAKEQGILEPPEHTDEMWEEAKINSGDMVGRFNCLIMHQDVVDQLSSNGFLFNEDLYPCEQVDGWFTHLLETRKISKIGLHPPVWHMRAMTYQRGETPMHDRGKSNPDYKKCPIVRRHL